MFTASRTPTDAAGIVIFTFNPYLTVISLAITALTDIYFLFGMFIEERRFLRISVTSSGSI